MEGSHGSLPGVRPANYGAQAVPANPPFGGAQTLSTVVPKAGCYFTIVPGNAGPTLGELGEVAVPGAMTLGPLAPPGPGAAAVLGASPKSFGRKPSMGAKAASKL